MRPVASAGQLADFHFSSAYLTGEFNFVPFNISQTSTDLTKSFLALLRQGCCNYLVWQKTFPGLLLTRDVQEIKHLIYYLCRVRFTPHAH